MNKTAFVISIVLTTFVLMAVGGIAYAVHAPQPTQAAPVAAPATVDPAAADPAAGDPLAVDPAVLQAWSEREAAYQQLIAEANARLEQAQQQLAAQAQSTNPQVGNTNTVPQTGVTPEQAAEIAANFLGQTSVYSVEIVPINGENLYLVTFYSGDLVYVGLNGQVVGSASLQAGGSGGRASSFSQANGGGEPGHDDHGEDHEGDEHSQSESDD